MDIRQLLAAVDHTVLDPDADWQAIKRACDEAVRYGTASVCIPPSYVARASEYVDGATHICTVIGFPNGYNTEQTKIFETRDAVRNGADEIDMVINIGRLKSADTLYVLDEIRAVRAACEGRILKVIVETCLLTETEKSAVCELVACSGADYIKTSTGFSHRGATKEDVAAFVRISAGRIRVKAAGGIRTLKDAEDFLRLGASRLGTSRIVGIVKNDAALDALFDKK